MCIAENYPISFYYQINICTDNRHLGLTRDLNLSQTRTIEVSFFIADSPMSCTDESIRLIGKRIFIFLVPSTFRNCEKIKSFKGSTSALHSQAVRQRASEKKRRNLVHPLRCYSNHVLCQTAWLFPPSLFCSRV